MADQILTMEIETQTLRSQVNFLTDELRWISEGIRGKHNELKWAESYMRQDVVHRVSKHGPKDPDNATRDRVEPITREIEVLETRKAALQAKLDFVQEELNNAVTLLDRCKRFSGTPKESGREVSAVGQTSGREFSPYL